MMKTPWDTETQLTERELNLLRRAAVQVVDSLFRREKNRVRAALLLHRASMSMDRQIMLSAAAKSFDLKRKALK